jgi:hypothetical protein
MDEALMETEKLNDYLFADLVTQWAARIARARAPRSAEASWSDIETSVTAADLKAALAQLEMRRSVVQGLREAKSSGPV